MLSEREDAFKNISRTLAITRYDIEQRQTINEYALNIHGENYFRDIINFIYGLELENANSENQNEACIDLIDKKNELLYQITTTRSKDKIDKTLLALKKDKYDGYDIKILYLLDKAKPAEKTINEVRAEYAIELKECLIDYTDLVRDINDLELNKLIELNSKYFKKEDYYTDKIILNLAFNHILKSKGNVKPNYNDDFGSIDTKEKLKLNNINERISFKINDGFDYYETLKSINDEEDILSDLKDFVVDELYMKVLVRNLVSKESKAVLEGLEVFELHDLARDHKLDFNKMIYDLSNSLENLIEIEDFNSSSISWIIIAYFFEICYVGAKK
jgi:hypothetical protein